MQDPLPMKHPVRDPGKSIAPDLHTLLLMAFDAGFAACIDWQHRRGITSEFSEVLPPPNPFAGRAPHTDDLAVARFAIAMQDKLAIARTKGRGGWEDRADYPIPRLTADLLRHVQRGDPVDVANFAMFAHQRGERLSAIGQALLTAGILQRDE